MTIHKTKPDTEMVAYVHRGNIYIPYAHAYPMVVSHLGMVCRYKVNTGKCFGWVVPKDIPGNKPMQELMSYLEGYSFRIEKVGVGNTAQVWT